jgi:hypothetical protein
MNGDNGFLVNERFDGDSISDVEGDGVETFQFPFKGMKPQRRMLRIEFKELECLFVLPDQIRMFLKETGGPRMSTLFDDFLLICQPLLGPGAQISPLLCQRKA